MATSLATPTSAGEVLKPVRPNAGIQAEYRRQLDALIAAMQASLVFWLKAQWRTDTPELAQDASAAAGLTAAMRKLSRRWMRNFDKAAPRIAAQFADKTKAYSDVAMQKILRDAGLTVRFQMTDTMQDAFTITKNEQVNLIRSIAAQHLAQVETLVATSVQTGRDLGTLTAELQKRYAITDRRAALIARDQNNKATATFTRVRQQDMGVTHARWRHSHGGKTPRPEHVAADGEKYDIRKGMYLEGVWTWPGVEINCRCVSEPIIPGLE